MASRNTTLPTGFDESSSPDARVDALWSFASSPASQPRGRQYVPPDCCVDVIVRLSDEGPPQMQLHGPVSCFHLEPVSDDQTLVAVRFRPGIAGPLLRSEELVRKVIEQAGDVREPQQVERILLPLLEDQGQPPALIRDFVSAVEETLGTSRLTPVLARLSAHERALQRASARWIGTSPKSFLRVTRILAARAALRQGRPIAEVAADLGFADQSHLTRDFREQLGITPGAVRRVGFVQDLLRESAYKRGPSRGGHPWKA